MDHEAVAIRARRTESNRAIAARDAAYVVGIMLSEVTVSVAGGPILRGRGAVQSALAEQFADKAFRGYVRDPDVVLVYEAKTHATERGQWSGLWRNDTGEHEMRGTYVAQWQRTEMGWFIESEIFTTGKWSPPR